MEAGTPLKVLILEDRPTDAELMVAELRRHGYAPEWRRVDGEAQFVAALDPSLDVILSDFDLPQYDALRAIAHVTGRSLEIPVIVVTGAVGEELAAECIKRGAADYLLKDRLGRLGAAVDQALERTRLRAEGRRAERELLASRAELATVFESAPVPMVILDAERRVVKANRAAVGLAHREAADAPGRVIGDALHCLFSVSDPAGCGFGPHCLQCPLRLLTIAAFSSGQEQRAVECALPLNRREEAGLTTLLVSAAPVETATGRFAVICMEDITARKQAEERVRRLNRLLATLGQINQLIVRGLDRGELLAECCRTLIEYGEFRMAWAGMVDRAAGEVRPVAFAGDDAGYLAGLQVRFDDTPLGRGPSGTAVRENRLVLVDDVASDASFGPWREESLRCGFRSVVSLPLTEGGAVVGVLSILAADSGVFDAEMLQVLGELGADLSFALEAQVTRATKEAAEQALRESEAKYRLLFERAPIGIYRTTPGGRILEANPALLALLGFASLAELAQRNLEESGFPDPGGRALFKAAMEGESAPAAFDATWMRKDGAQVHVREYASAIRDASGRILWYEGTAEDVTERRRAEETERKRVRQLLTVSRVARRLGTLLDEPTLAAAAVRDIQGAFEYFNVALLFLDEEKGELGRQAMAGAFAGLADPQYCHPVSLGLIGKVARTGAPVVVNDISKSPDYVEGFPQAAATRAEVAVPVLFGGQVLAVLDVQESKVDAFDEVDVLTLEILAGEIAIAIHNARLFADLQRELGDRRRAEDALRGSEARYRHLVEHAEEMIYRVDARGRITYCNPATARTLGSSSEDLVGRHYLEFVREDRRQDAREFFKRKIAERVAGTSYEWPVPRADGSEIWLSASVQLVFEGDEVVAFQAVARDVTDRVRAREALRESEERYRGLFENLPTGVYRTTPDGRILAANPSLLNMLGYATFDELAGANVEMDELIRREERERYKQVLERHGEVSGFETVWLAKGGRPVEVRESARAARGEDGAVLFFEGTVEDISESRRTAAALREAEERFRQAQKMEAIGRLAGGVAHDFNNLLQALMGQTAVLRNRLGEPQRIESCLGELEQQIRRGAALTRQLLLFSRRGTTRFERVDLNELLRSSVSFLRHLVREDIALDLVGCERPLPVDADRSQLDQVLMNLVVNAVDATPSGGRVTVRCGEDGEKSVWFAVEDTGHGIPGEIADKIFEPFFTTKGEGKGTGLGLSVVHGIVTQAGGRIEVRSRPGQGTSFRIVLPAATAAEPEGAVAGGGEAAPPLGGGGERVLIVEDEPAARQALHEIVTVLGYQATAAGSAADAEALPEEPPFDLLLTDLLLPDATGDALAQRLSVRWPRLSVILMSGYTEDESIRSAVTEGSLRFLQKPFDVGTLSRELAGALRSRKPQPGSEDGQE